MRTQIERSTKSLPIYNEEPLAAASSGNINLVGRVLTPFAALLVKLSRDAAAAMARIERLTRNLFATIIALRTSAGKS